MWMRTVSDDYFVVRTRATFPSIAG
jgi:hypothetical protein